MSLSSRIQFIFCIFAGINIVLHIFSNAGTLISVLHLPEVAMLTQKLTAFLIFIDTFSKLSKRFEAILT